LLLQRLRGTKMNMRPRNLAKHVIELARCMRFLSNGYAAFWNLHRGINIRSLDFWDGTRMRTRDGGAAAHIFSDIFLHRCYDFPEIRSADQIVDVGANIGLFSYFARRQNPHAKITAIEADPRTEKILRSNVESKQVDVIHSAASDEPGVVSFYSSNVSGWSSLYGVRGATGADRVDVPAARLSKLLQDKGITKIDFLKIDAEGAEYPILLGDLDLLGKIEIEALVVEVDRVSRDTRYNYDQLYEQLQRSFSQVSIKDSN
jgi:FkbM family methyltransferase